MPVVKDYTQPDGPTSPRAGVWTVSVRLPHSVLKPVPGRCPAAGAKAPGVTSKTARQTLDQSPLSVKDLYVELEAFLLGLGDDVQMNDTQTYIAFRRIKNFACVAAVPTYKSILVWVKVDPKTVALEEGFAHVSKLGHRGRATWK